MKSRKITVCFVQPVQSPYWTERFKALAKSDDLDIVLLLERDSFTHRPGWKPEPIPGVRTIILGSQVTKVSAKHADLGYQIDGIRAVPWQLSKVLLNIKPDVVVVCNATQLLLALPARLMLGFHLSLIVEDTPHATRNHSWIKNTIKKNIYRRADSWMPFSIDAYSYINTFGLKQNIYPNCWSIDTEYFLPDEQRQSVSPPYTVSVVAALTSLKGIMPLLDTWNSIDESKRANFTLKIAGTGPLRPSIEHFINAHQIKDVELLGQIPYSQVIELLQESILFVLPTLQDLCSLTVPEAMACGCPVITTPYNGARDLISHDVDGWIADPAKPGDLKAKLESALSDINRLRLMSKNARIKALSRDNRVVMQKLAEQLRTMSNS